MQYMLKYLSNNYHDENNKKLPLKKCVFAITSKKASLLSVDPSLLDIYTFDSIFPVGIIRVNCFLDLAGAPSFIPIDNALSR